MAGLGGGEGAALLVRHQGGLNKTGPVTPVGLTVGSSPWETQPWLGV